MSYLKKMLMLLSFVPALLCTNAMAVDSEELVEARQGLMKLYSVNMDLLAEMTRRAQPYNPVTAKSAADNLLALAKMDIGALWPEGTSQADKGYENKTTAKPDIWKNREKVAQSQQDLVTALEVLSKDAAWSLEYLQDGIRDVAEACKGCHKQFRAKK